MSQDKIIFSDKINEYIEQKVNFKMTFSKQRHQNKEVLKAFLKTVVIKNKLQYSVTYRYQRKDQVKNYERIQLPELLDNLMGNMFFNAVLFSENEEYTLLQSKKGKSTLISKVNPVPVKTDTSHDNIKYRFIPESSPWLQDLGLASKEGKIFDKAQDKYRQINKYVEIVDGLLKDIPEESMLTIADMGSGKGYLTFALYDYLTNTRKLFCKVTGYDVREDIIGLCYNVAAKYGFVGLTFQQKDIDQVDTSDADVVIALHACDIATDMAIAKGIQGQAKYIIVAPCCHKQIRNAMQHNNLLSPILKHGILEERQAEIVTDGIRSLIMEANGYQTKVFEFISTEHTPKNLMITGKKSIPDATALSKVQEIKAFFGIEYHYLEKLLEIAEVK